jgi:diguanylate cyclase (GGDEF)-like protein
VTSLWSLVRTLLAWRPPPLRFEPQLERQFEQTLAPSRLRNFIPAGIVALVVINLGLWADRSLLPDVWLLSMKLRLFVFTPLALALLVIGVWFKRWALSMPVFLTEGLVTMTGVVAALLMGIPMVLTESPTVVMYRVGLMAILVYGNLVQRFRFRHAVGFSVCVLLVTLVGMSVTWQQQDNPYAVLDVPVGLLILLIALYTLTMNFRMELEERRRFLRTERAAVLRKEIDDSMRALDALSRRDPLTGVANRRHVDEVMHQCWQAHLQSHGALALLLIDVDHFKAYNDRYGHPTGDQCLREVAQLLKRRVPPSVGLVSRWGGEEFLVVLPRADAHKATHMAQSLIEAVAALGLRHEASPTAPTVTISVGVGVVDSAHSLACADELIAQSDLALYRAKHTGRHRFVLASP